jgi:archaea-specific DNA-binding protein
LLINEDKIRLGENFPNSESKTILIHQQDVIPCALDLLTELVKHNTITLVAKGQSIPTAVSVANVVTENMMKGNAKVLDIIVDSEETNEKSGPSLVSIIKIVITKTN